jgi:hypothetical protein
MKSIQNQYIDLKEGRMSQANFMRNVRMTLPQYVTNVTSFKDAVRILKNKAILNEVSINELSPQTKYNAAMKAVDKSYMSDNPSDIDRKKAIRQGNKFVSEIDPVLKKAVEDFGNSLGFNTKIEKGGTGNKLEPIIQILMGKELRAPEIKVTIKKGTDKIEGGYNLPDEAAERRLGNLIKQIQQKELDVELNEGALGSDVELYQKYLDELNDVMGDGLSYADAIVKVADENGISQDDLSTMVPEQSVGNKAYADNYNELYEAKDPVEDTIKSYLIKGYSYAEAIKLTAAEQGMDEEVLMSQYPQDTVDIEGYEDEEDDEEFLDMIAKAKKEKEEEEGIKSGFGIQDPMEDEDDEPQIPEIPMFKGTRDALDSLSIREGKKKKSKKELHPNQINPSELRMGIKVELEHTDELDVAKKIALDHLAENPYYYTALKLAGVESPSAPKAKVPVAFKKEVSAAVELVDKANAMKPVKGFEKAKASSNKAKKETNKVVKGVEELTHNAQSVRGLQKFAATGGKMKTIKLKEEIDPEIEGKPSQAYLDFLARKKQGKELMQATNADGVKFSVNDMAVAPNGKEIKITGFTTGKDGKTKAIYSAGMFADVYNLDDLKKKSSFKPGVDLGASFEKFKSTLEALVREVVNETFDGRDNLTDVE